VESKDLEVAFHRSLLAFECREQCPLGAAWDGRKQGKVLLRWCCQTETAVQGNAPALHESRPDCCILRSRKTANLWSLWLQLPWGQELVFIEKSECTEPAHGFTVCSPLSVHSQCLPRGRFYVTYGLTGMS